MRFKKTIASLLVGASALSVGGIANIAMPTQTADAAASAVTFTSVSTVKVHAQAGGTTELYLSFLNGNSPLKAYIAGGTTEDNNTRLMHFAKQIKFTDANGDTYNFASAGKVTTQGTTAGDELNVNLLFQKVNSSGAIVPFETGDTLTFPQGMVYEADTNADAAIDTVWNFASTFTVQYNPVSCANTFGCLGQGGSGKVSCNATLGYHVNESTEANSYDAIANSYFGGSSTNTGVSMEFSNNTTMSANTIHFGYCTTPGNGQWTAGDQQMIAFADKILVNDTKFSSMANFNIAALDQKAGLYVGNISMMSGGTVVVPQGVTFTSASGVKMTTMCKFTWTYTGAAGSPWTATAQYISGQIAERVGLEADMPTSGGNQGGGTSGDSSSGDSSGDSGDQGNTEAKPNRLLASFNSSDTQVFRDDAFYAQTVNKDTHLQNYYYQDVHKVTGAVTKRPGTSWDIDYKSTISYDKTPYNNRGESYPWYINNTYQLKGEFTTANVPTGSDGNGVYKFHWDQKIPGMWYPSIMFGFPNMPEYSPDDELEFTIYLSEGFNTSYTLWATSALEKNCWDAQKKFTGSLIPTGRWTTISIPMKDFLKADGSLAPIAFTFVYADVSKSLDTTGENDDGNNLNDGLDPSAIYFDKVEVKTVVKTLETNYREQDLSDVVPITKEMSFAGEFATNTSDAVLENFDFSSQDKNIKFLREDISTNVVKLKMSITANATYDMYFVMNGTGKYYDKGGIFYWLNDGGINVGYNGKAYAKGEVPAKVKNGETFELELRAIPYYVEGVRAGFFAEMLIDGVKACESAYISSADCSFGQYFGFYMHTTKTNVTAKIAPVTQATTSPLSLTVKPSPSTTHLDIDADRLMKATLKCKMYGQSDITIEVIDGTDYAYVDEENYIIGTASGIATVVAKVTNVFGTFTGEPFLIAIGDAELPQDSAEDSSQDSSTQDSAQDTTVTPPASEEEEPDYVRPNNGGTTVKTGGCGSSIGVGAVAMLSVALAAAFVVRKNKED